MDSNFDSSKYLRDDRAVLIFAGGQVEQINDVCRAMSEGLELLGYELEYIAGEEITERITSEPSDDASFEFSNFRLCGHRGHLHVQCTTGRIIFYFSPVYGREEREAMKNYKQYVRRLGELHEDSRPEYSGGENERLEQLSKLNAFLSGADVQSLRVQRRVEQIQLLERCFEMEPISGELADVTALCNHTFTRCAELLSDKRIIFRSTTSKVLERVFNHDEVERMFCCLLTGSLAMCGDEPIEVAASISEDTLRIDLFSEAEGFNDINFAKAMRLPLETDGFADTGHGLELLLASEIANRYFGKLQFYRSGGVGRLSAFITPSFYGMEYDLHNAVTIASNMYPQYIIELSELL